jgi:hypothetical protein
MAWKPKSKSQRENYEELLTEARQLCAQSIRIALNQRASLHSWAVAAYEKALGEKEVKSNGTKDSSRKSD